MYRDKKRERLEGYILRNTACKEYILREAPGFSLLRSPTTDTFMTCPPEGAERFRNFINSADLPLIYAHLYLNYYEAVLIDAHYIINLHNRG